MFSFMSVGSLYLTKLTATRLAGVFSSAGSHGSSQLHFGVLLWFSKWWLCIWATWRTAGFVAGVFQVQAYIFRPSFILAC